MPKNRGFLPRPGRFYIENVQSHIPRIGASCLERGGGGGGWWWWLVVGGGGDGDGDGGGAGGGGGRRGEGGEEERVTVLKNRTSHKG